MTIIQFIRLIVKHKIILGLIPIMFALLTIVLTSNQAKVYYSETMLYTGIGSGSSIEMDKQFNYLANNNAFDNLINLIKSRETKQEVAIRLLAQHLMLDGPNRAYLSEEAYNSLHEILPEEITSYLVRSKNPSVLRDKQGQIITQKPWSEEDYEATVDLLFELKESNNQNFVYSLLNFDHPYYSVESIGKVKVDRMSSSDLLKLSYENDDPGICQQTLKIYTEVCIKKYKDLKENGSDRVVKYFEGKLAEAEGNLAQIEEELLKFNQDNSIINYYEQSKAFAIIKEEAEEKFRADIANLAGVDASINRLEDKLRIQESIQQKNQVIVDLKNDLSQINYVMTILESKKSDSLSSQLLELKSQGQEIEKALKNAIDELYVFTNSKDGVPIEKVMPDWINKIVEREDLKAKLEIVQNQNQELNNQFNTYAPAGANLKRIEREIDVAEQEYLEILHGLNLAKLKFQDVQLTSNIKALDQPFYPLNPNPSKRKIIILAVGFMSGVVVLISILLLEFFDNTLKNQKVASSKLGVPSIGMLPKISVSHNSPDFIRVQDRLMDFVMHNLEHALSSSKVQNRSKLITVFSTESNEGKTTIVRNIARKLKESGKTVLIMNHSDVLEVIANNDSLPWLHRLLGYEDPRIDYNHPFLSLTSSSFGANEEVIFEIDQSYQQAKTVQELNCHPSPDFNVDYILVELPNVLGHHYPTELLQLSDLSVLVCRSNRVWSNADANILKNINELIGAKVRYLINGVAMEEVESLLGDLPKNRSFFRQKIKDLLRFQFNSKGGI